jgi:aspartyl-tRNA(Asn)/glutamyl-tRNA(Gln) amidotransferase subunit A
MTEYLTITDAAAALRSGEVTSVELMRRALAVADAVDEKLGTFLNRFVDSSLAAAAAADAALAAGAEVGPLHGIPLGIKDIITTSEAPSTAQSLVLDPAWSAGDAVVVSRLRAAGGIVAGKLSTMEFAIGAPDATKPFPIPRNPWNPAHWAGGSSSGSGSGVATGAVLGALGTDTGGSIRIPAAYCGITGLMPTFGRVPKSGCVPLGYSLDHIGPMARSARDCALMLTALAGHHPSDSSALDVEVPDYLSGLTGDLSGLRIGVDRLSRIGGDAEDPAVPAVFAAVVTALESLGATIVEVELPHYAEMTSAGMVIMFSEALAYHRPDMQTRWSDYAAGTRKVIGSGLCFTAADYVQAQRVRRAGQRAVAELFTQVDLLLTPTVGAGATSFEELDATVRDLSTGAFGPTYTPYWDTTGHPVLSVPAGFTANGLPLGMQLIGRPLDEPTVLKAGDAFQQVTDWHLRVPPIAAETTQPQAEEALA